MNSKLSKSRERTMQQYIISPGLHPLSFMEIIDEYMSLLLVEYSKNKFTCEILEGLIQGDTYRVVDDIIYYQGQIYLLPKSQLKEKIMQASHSSPLGGHLGYLKAYRKITKRFTWKGLNMDVFRFVNECNIFQQNKVEHTHSVGLLQRLPILEKK